MSGHMLGYTLVTNQTGADGQKVSKVLIHEGVDFDNEFYFAILLEREYDGPVLVGSPMGGMDIEEVAEKHPESLKFVPVDIKAGIKDEAVYDLAKFMGFDEHVLDDAVTQI